MSESPSHRAFLPLTILVFVAIGVCGYIVFIRSGIDFVDLMHKTVRKIAAIFVYMIPLPIILFLSHRYSATKDNRVYKPALLLDFSYYLINFVMKLSVLAIFGVGLKMIYKGYLDFLTLDFSREWPFGVKIIAAFLFSDFLGWMHHVVRHKVPAFWYFHTVHHSQQHMNYFTDARIHMFDYFISGMIRFIPGYMVALSAPTVIVMAVVLKWHRMTYHSNLKTNYGILKYLLVTPQSHRIHHSQQQEHYDKNFGVNLSIWDHIFGTQYTNYEEYPEAGVADEHFPREQGVHLYDMLGYYGAQFAYPFQQFFRKKE